MHIYVLVKLGGFQKFFKKLKFPTFLEIFLKTAYATEILEKTNP